jgi:hypothetical protein
VGVVAAGLVPGGVVASVDGVGGCVVGEVVVVACVVVGRVVVVVVDVGGLVVVVVVDVVDVVELVEVDGVWAGTSGGDCLDEPLRTLAAAAVTPPTTRTVATAMAASLRAAAPIRDVLSRAR